MNKGLIAAVMLAAGTFAMKADFPLLSSFVSPGHAIEVQHGDLNKKALATACYGVNVTKSGSLLATTFTVEGFYNGNFDVEFNYLLGKSSPKEGPFAARETKPDGSAGDYAGKYLSIERGIAVNTKIGALYFAIPDTLGLKNTLNTMLTLSSACDANNYGGYDLKFKTVTIEGSTLETLYEVFKSYGDNGVIGSDVLSYILESSDVTIGAFKLTIANEDGSASSTVNMEGYDLSTYTPNASVTDKYYLSNTASISTSTADRAYDGMMQVNDDGTFSLINFSNRGFAIASATEDDAPVVSLSGVNGAIDWSNNTFTLEDKQQLYLDLTYYNSLTLSLLGDGVINKGVLYAAKSGLFGVLSTDTSNPQVSGTATYDDVQSSHSGTNLWAKSVAGGDLSTTASGTVNLEIPTYCAKWDKAIVSLSNGIESHTNFIASTLWSVPSVTRDITHDVSFSALYPATLEYDNAAATLKLSGAVADENESGMVDHYEVYLHHKSVTHVANSVLGLLVNTSDYSSEYGLTNSIKAADTDENGAFFGEVALADVPNNNSKPLFGSKSDIDPENDEFTLYVRAVYADESLSPTFHALTTVKTTVEKIETGVAGAKDYVKVAGGKGCIEVYGVETLSVYDLSGTALYSGAGTNLPLPMGVYVVKADDVLYKVVVR
jgi:hypothetical protein